MLLIFLHTICLSYFICLYLVKLYILFLGNRGALLMYDVFCFKLIMNKNFSLIVGGYKDNGKLYIFQQL